LAEGVVVDSALLVPQQRIGIDREIQVAERLVIDKVLINSFTST